MPQDYSGEVLGLVLHESWLCQMHPQPKIQSRTSANVLSKWWRSRTEVGAHAWIDSGPVTVLTTVRELGSEAVKIRKERRSQKHREQEKLSMAQRRIDIADQLKSYIYYDAPLT